jgi:hypothetical protein
MIEIVLEPCLFLESSKTLINQLSISLSDDDDGPVVPACYGAGVELLDCDAFLGDRILGFVNDAEDPRPRIRMMM